MKKLSKDIQEDILNPMKKKRLMKLNKFLSSKYVLCTLVLLIAIGLFAICNYLLNSFSNIKYILRDIQNPQLYLSARNFILINKENWFFYILIILFICIADVLLIYKIRTAYKDLNVGQKGTERWTTLDEIKEQYRAVPEKTYPFKGKGGVPICRYEDQIFIDDSPVNTLVIGITRAGKGETITYPTIDIYSRCEEKPSMIITDPKLDEYPTCYYTLTSRGYDVYLFNLNDPLNSMAYNPIQLCIDEYKAGREAEAELVLHNYCYSIFHTKASANTKEPFFPDGSTNVLYCLIWAQIEDNLKADRRWNNTRGALWAQKQKDFEKLSEEQQKAVRKKIKTIDSQDRLLNFKYIPPELHFVPTTENEKKCNMFSALKTFLSLMDVKVKQGKETITALDVYFSIRPIGDKAKMRYASIKSASPNQKGNLFQYMLQQVQQYLLENVAQFTAENTLKISDIGFGEKPVAVFLTIPDYDDSLHILATTFIDQVYFALSKQAGRSRKKRCNRDVIFYLEEVGNMPEIKNLKSGITMGLSRGFKFILSLQAYSQLEDIYGEKAAKTIIGNCGNQIYIKTDDNQTAKDFSALIGGETMTNVSRMGAKLSLNKTYTETYEAKPLLNENELMDLKEGECVVKRTMRRRDLKGNKIREFPIFNHGETAFKMRYEYMLDEFPSDIDLYSLPTGDNSTIDLDEHTFDLSAFFTDLLQDKDEFPASEGDGAKNMKPTFSAVKEKKVNIDALRDNKALVAEIPNGNILLSMLQNMLQIDKDDITIAEAITEIELAEAACMLTAETKENLFSLLDECEVDI